MAADEKWWSLVAKYDIIQQFFLSVIWAIVRIFNQRYSISSIFLEYHNILWENSLKLASRERDVEKSQTSGLFLWALLALLVWLVFTKAVPGLCAGQLCVYLFLYWLNPLL